MNSKAANQLSDPLSFVKYIASFIKYITLLWWRLQLSFQTQVIILYYTCRYYYFSSFFLFCLLIPQVFHFLFYFWNWTSILSQNYYRWEVFPIKITNMISGPNKIVEARNWKEIKSKNLDRNILLMIHHYEFSCLLVE